MFTTQEQFDEAYRTSHELDPETTSWGLFAYSDAPPNVCGSGLGSFQWFQAKAEMLRFVRDFMAWWNPAPSSMEPEDIAEGVQSVISDAGETPDLAELRERLNDFMGNMWHIEWWGQFNELCESADEFPLKVRHNFLDDQDPDSPTGYGASAVAVEQLGDFKEYLREYGV
jgi:hypothetical protein